MKKVAILTINDNNNYGNRLQNYATQEIIKRQGVKVETISNIKGLFGVRNVKKEIKDVIKRFPILRNKFCRYNSFIRFNRNIKASKFHIDENHISKKIPLKYDYFFTGSDQVWNPTFGRMSDIDFLTFAPEKKRNSLSASIGIDRIPSNKEEYYISRLKKMNKISVREENAKKIIEDLTGRTDIEVLIDPTMMLTEEDWDKVSKTPKRFEKKKYILNYFLGELSDDRKKEIDRIAKENKCKIINLLDKHEILYNVGPAEFLYLEKNAFLICTDSFHSSVFAILFNRPFIVFDREQKNMQNMNSRLETLLSKFKLKDRKYNGKKITKENLNHDYTEAYQILEEERKKSDKFLSKALEIKESE